MVCSSPQRRNQSQRNELGSFCETHFWSVDDFVSSVFFPSPDWKWVMLTISSGLCLNQEEKSKSSSRRSSESSDSSSVQSAVDGPTYPQEGLSSYMAHGSASYLSLSSMCPTEYLAIRQGSIISRLINGSLYVHVYTHTIHVSVRVNAHLEQGGSCPESSGCFTHTQALQIHRSRHCQRR